MLKPFLTGLFSTLLCLSLGAQNLQPPPQLNIESNGGGDFTLSWEAENLRPYFLETSIDLQNWFELPNNPVLGTGSTRMVMVQSNAGETFFRHREGATRRGMFMGGPIAGCNAFGSPVILDGRIDTTDDGSSHIVNGLPDFDFANVELGFTIDIFGNDETKCFVNNNGNITFEEELSAFTPTPLQNVGQALIAPFWADVDTSNLEQEEFPFDEIAREVTYGQGTVNGNLAFGVNWFDVGYFDFRTNLLNTFQLVLINRPDTGNAKNFDIEFNYDQIDWETGEHFSSGGTEGLGGFSARVGLSDGVSETIEISSSAVNSVLLDEDPITGLKNFTTGLIYRSRNSTIPGRFVFQIRNGAVLGALSVDAGLDVNTTTNPEIVQLAGTATDPSGGAVTVEWSVLDGGDGITFSNVTDLNTTMTVPNNISAVIQLTATSVSDPTISAADIFELN